MSLGPYRALPLSAIRLILSDISYLLSASSIYVGYSGGVDSHVLLHILSSIPAVRHKLVAIYINHNLHPSSYDWGNHCKEQCSILGIPLELISVNASPVSGLSPEAVARDERYQAFSSFLLENDVLVVAQHEEDQMETFLLQMLRGAGVDGLASMPLTSSLGKGKLARPLLDKSKKDILKYAVDHKLKWIDDPSNNDSSYDRNYLRNHIIPLIKHRWPNGAHTVSRSASHCAKASRYISQFCRANLSLITNFDDSSLELDKLLKYESDEQSWLVRSWLSSFELEPPSQRQLDVLFQQVIHARKDSNPTLAIQGRNIGRFRDNLYCYLSTGSVIEGVWPSESIKYEVAKDIFLTRHLAQYGICRDIWHASKIEVRQRHGGEKIRSIGNQTQTLKNVLQEIKMPVWKRQALPLIYFNEELVAIPGVWISPDICGDEYNNYEIQLIIE